MTCDWNVRICGLIWISNHETESCAVTQMPSVCANTIAQTLRFQFSFMQFIKILIWISSRTSTAGHSSDWYFGHGCWIVRFSSDSWTCTRCQRKKRSHIIKEETSACHAACRTMTYTASFCNTFSVEIIVGGGLTRNNRMSSVLTAATFFFFVSPSSMSSNSSF